MDVKAYHRNQRDLGKDINNIVNAYWEDEISKVELEDFVFELYDKNEPLFVKDGVFTTILQQQCGRRRLEIVAKILQLRGVIVCFQK